MSSTATYLEVMVLHVYRYHPDKNVNNPEAAGLFQEVAYSYSILSDAEKRRQYDNAGFQVVFYKINTHHFVCIF